MYIKRAKSKAMIQASCETILRNSLYAEWGNIVDWSNHHETYNVTFVAIAYIKRKAIGTVIVSDRRFVNEIDSGLGKECKVSVFVKAECRRMGIGTALFNALPKKYKHKGKVQYPFDKRHTGKIIRNRAKGFFDSVGKVAE